MGKPTLYLQATTAGSLIIGETARHPCQPGQLGCPTWAVPMGCPHGLSPLCVTANTTYVYYNIVTLCFDSLVIRLRSKDLKHLIPIGVNPEHGFCINVSPPQKKIDSFSTHNTGLNKLFHCPFFCN